MEDADLDVEIRLAIKRLAIPVPEAWLPAISEHLRAIRRAGDLVESFPLPDEIDQAPTFEA